MMSQSIRTSQSSATTVGGSGWEGKQWTGLNLSREAFRAALVDGQDDRGRRSKESWTGLGNALINEVYIMVQRQNITGSNLMAIG